ncbi:MAG TPA: hypothetical protein VIS72_12735 [Anaerolineales bacterium]
MKTSKPIWGSLAKDECPPTVVISDEDIGFTNFLTHGVTLDSP